MANTSRPSSQSLGPPDAAMAMPAPLMARSMNGT